MNDKYHPPRDPELRRLWKIYHYAEHYGLTPRQQGDVLQQYERYEDKRSRILDAQIFFFTLLGVLLFGLWLF